MKSFQNTLKQFGLNDKQIELYQHLVGKGWQTILQISKQTELPRTTIYRIIGELTEMGLIEEKVDFKTSYYQSTSVHSFESLILEKEKSLTYLKHQIPALKNHLAALSLISNTAETQVHFYRGLRGLKTMEWKLCEAANSTTYVFGDGKWHNVMGRDFAEEIRHERINQNIKIKEILNPDKITPVSEDGTIEWTSIPGFIKNHYQHRQIAKNILNIENEIIIVPDKVFLFSIQDNEIVGIEIISPAYAQFFTQLFNIIWNQAEVIDDFGK